MIRGLDSASLARLRRGARIVLQSSRPSLRSHHTSAALHVARLKRKMTPSSGPQLCRLCAPSPRAHNTSRPFPQLRLLVLSILSSADTPRIPRIERAGRSPHRQKTQEIQTFEQDSSAHKNPQLPVSPCQRRPWPRVADHTELFLNPPRQLRMLGARPGSSGNLRTPSGRSR